MSKLTITEKITKEHHKNQNLGVLYTGYLEKQNPRSLSGSYRKRFVVLTHESLHWFTRTEGYDLFGEERGNIPLGNIVSSRILDEDSNIFEVVGSDSGKKLFRAASPSNCEEWVSAIRSAKNSYITTREKEKDSKDADTGKTIGSPSSVVGSGGAAPLKRMISRRTSLSGIRNIFEDHTSGPIENGSAYETRDVDILLVSKRLSSSGMEVVLARNPSFGLDSEILLGEVCEGDEVLIATSDCGCCVLSFEMLARRSDDEMEFDQPIQDVPLASSLRLAIRRTNRTPYGNKKNSTNSSTISTSSSSSVSSDSNDKNNNNNNRSSVLNTCLSLVVLLVACASVFFHNWSMTTISTICLSSLMLLFNLNQVRKATTTNKTSTSKTDKTISSTSSTSSSPVVTSLTLGLVVLAHNFTSPDAPINEPEDEIPQRFLDGCEGDVKEARRRWDITRRWREEEGVNTILQKPQVNFEAIKQFYPHYHAGRGKEGHMVFYERPGDFNGPELASRGIRTDELVQHWLFITEYQWEVLYKGDQSAKTISVFDLKNVKLSDLAGENLTYVKRTLGYANAHYPERSFVIYLINAPWYASVGWKLVKPLIHPNTQRKVRILSAKETLTGLMEHVDVTNIPILYGGQLDYGGGGDSCRFKSPETIEIHEFVKQLNSGNPPYTPPMQNNNNNKNGSQQSVKRTSLISSPSNNSHRVHFLNDQKTTDEEWSVASVTTASVSPGMSTPTTRKNDAKGILNK